MYRRESVHSYRGAFIFITVFAGVMILLITFFVYLIILAQNKTLALPRSLNHP